MAAGVDLRAHRTGRVRHEVLGTAFNGADDVRGSDIAAHARIGHDRASKVGVLTTCRRGTAKRGALTASEAETGRHVHENQPQAALAGEAKSPPSAWKAMAPAAAATIFMVIGRARDAKSRLLSA